VLWQIFAELEHGWQQLFVIKAAINDELIRFLDWQTGPGLSVRKPVSG
jgi:hypothetical protein